MKQKFLTIYIMHYIFMERDQIKLLDIILQETILIVIIQYTKHPCVHKIEENLNFMQIRNVKSHVLFCIIEFS